jgi:hypothetical protein
MCAITYPVKLTIGTAVRGAGVAFLLSGRQNLETSRLSLPLAAYLLGVILPPWFV